jgi:predicted DCC family thiol-disulfide oxidoreductase YuxK
VPSENASGEQPFKKQSNNKPILFFDGVCSLCNFVVDFVIQNETASFLNFASLQGKTAKSLLKPQDREGLDSLIVLAEGKTYFRSDAVLLVLQWMGGAYAFLARTLRLIPRSLLDSLYDFVARHRYRWFGQRQSCRMPTEQEKNRLLP